MSFLSLKFAFCLALGLIVFHSSPARWRAIILFALSLGFYATWSVWHTLLLLAITGAVYAAARFLERTPSERSKLRIVVTAITALLLLLAVFKCGQILADLIASHWADSTIDAALLLVAPLGLSYYLFKLLGYLLDVYWEKIPAQHNFLTLALYSSFFPQLVCGPIQRADDFFAQFDNIKQTNPEQFVRGLRRILFGLFKKIVIADQLAMAVARLHSDPAAHSSLELLLGAYCFSLQMYADFSGITDLAIGIGQLFGIQGPENFDLPYFSRNIQEFWRRWHMSLTSWLSDYLFLPLRMTFRSLGNLGLSLAIFINMLAVAVWHGPRLLYIIFGCINGIFVVVSALTLKQRNGFFKRHARLAQLRAVGAPLLTFHMVVFTHIFFQAADLHAAVEYLRLMITGLTSHSISPTRIDWSTLGLSRLRFSFALAGLLAAEAIHWGLKQPAWVGRFFAAPRVLRWGACYLLVVLVLLSARGSVSFIYAKF